MPKMEELKLSNAELNMLHAQLLGKDYRTVTVRKEHGVVTWTIFDRDGSALDTGSFR